MEVESCRCALSDVVYEYVGIPDLVEGYRLFRERIEKAGKSSRAPQLILVCLRSSIVSCTEELR